jgi:hypothetical protein
MYVQVASYKMLDDMISSTNGHSLQQFAMGVPMFRHAQIPTEKSLSHTPRRCVYQVRGDDSERSRRPRPVQALVGQWPTGPHTHAVRGATPTVPVSQE